MRRRTTTAISPVSGASASSTPPTSPGSRSLSWSPDGSSLISTSARTLDQSLRATYMVHPRSMWAESRTGRSARPGDRRRMGGVKPVHSWLDHRPTGPAGHESPALTRKMPWVGAGEEVIMQAVTVVPGNRRVSATLDQCPVSSECCAGSVVVERRWRWVSRYRCRESPNGSDGRVLPGEERRSSATSRWSGDRSGPTGLAVGDHVVGIVRRPDPTPCRNAPLVKWKAGPTAGTPSE